jgi:hypothetical protein
MAQHLAVVPVVMTRAGSTVDLSEASVNSSRNDSVRWCRRSGEGLDDATIPRSAGFGWPIRAGGTKV